MVWPFFSKAKAHKFQINPIKPTRKKKKKIKRVTKYPKEIFKIINHVSVENNSTMPFRKTKNEDKTHFSAYKKYRKLKLCNRNPT